MDLKQAAPVAFINVTERDRALGFYRDVLGFSLESSDGFGDFIDMGAGMIRMTVLPGFQAQGYPVLGWDVADIGAAVAALGEKGVTMIVYDGMGQDAQGIWTSPDGGSKVSFFADPDGNVLTLSQR